VLAVTNGTKPPTVVPSRTRALPKPGSNQSVARPSPAPVVVPSPPAVPVEVVKLPPEPVAITVSDETQNSVPPPPTVVSTNATAGPVPKMERRGVFSRLNPFKRDAKPAADETALTASGPISALPVSAPDSPLTAGGRYVYHSPGVPQAGDRPSAERALIMGQQAQNIGRLAEAIQAYRRAGQLDGSYFEAHYRLGLAAFEARSFRLALSAWETALALQPDSADARYNFGLTLKASNYPNDAATELEKLLAVHPDEARGHLTLGNLYAEQLHDLSRARQHYGRVLLLDPRNPQAQAIRYWLVANPG
jgi:hypothetical protein